LYATKQNKTKKMKKIYISILIWISVLTFSLIGYSQTTILPQSDKIKNNNSDAWDTQANSILSDTCITVRTTYGKGKTALLWDLSPTTNYGTHPDFTANAWTWNGTPTVCRCLMDIDIHTLVPIHAIITSAALYLYHDNSVWTQGHSTINGSNDCWIRRVTSSWNESTVTWGTQPSYTTQNEVYLPASTNDTMNYPNIDVTNLVKDIWNNYSTSFGFIIMLNTEQHYRSLLFGSNNCADSTKRPVFKICYHIDSSIPDYSISGDGLSLVYPNPAENNINIEFKSLSGSDVVLEFYSVSGELIDRVTIHSTASGTNIYPYALDSGKYPMGVYFVKLISGTGTGTQRFVKVD
jgi:hypothetical protein